MEKDRRLRLANQQRLRELRRQHGAQVTIFCGHDPIEFEAMTGRAMDAPVAAPPAWSGQPHLHPH